MEVIEKTDEIFSAVTQRIKGIASVRNNTLLQVCQNFGRLSYPLESILKPITASGSLTIADARYPTHLLLCYEDSPFHEFMSHELPPGVPRFEFDDMEECKKTSELFWFGDFKVNAKSYYDSITRLKSRIFQMI